MGFDNSEATTVSTTLSTSFLIPGFSITCCVVSPSARTPTTPLTLLCDCAVQARDAGRGAAAAPWNAVDENDAKLTACATVAAISSTPAQQTQITQTEKTTPKTQLTQMRRRPQNSLECEGKWMVKNCSETVGRRGVWWVCVERIANANEWGYEVADSACGRHRSRSFHAGFPIVVVVVGFYSSSRDESRVSLSVFCGCPLSVACFLHVLQLLPSV